jgi:hypothetical protein
MNRHRNVFSAILTFGLIFFASLAQINAQRSQVNEREVRSILRQLTVKLDDFQYGLDNELRQNSANQNEAEDLQNSLDALQTEVNNFQNKFTRRRDSQADVSQILSSAETVDESLSRLRVSQKLQRDWTSTRQLLNQLANNYGVRGGDSNDDDNSQLPDNQLPTQTTRNNNFSYGLTGTYQLDVSRSENARDVAERAITNSTSTQNRDEARRDLEEKLEAPERLAIDVKGNQVTLASTLAPQVTVTADGRDRTETLADGRTLRIRTTLRGQELIVSSVGGSNDYTVTFASTENGRSMKVTRRVTTDYLNQTVFAESVYTKTDAVARYDIYNTTTVPNTIPNTNYPPTTTQGRTGEFIVPNGTIITGNLENDITTKVSQNNDRFRMTVSAPNQFRGAVIEGYISGINRSGKVTGRSQLTFNFERIIMPDGKTYDFAGFLQSVTDANGKTVKIDTEGAVKGDSQTKETAKRGGIGAGLGAIIGAIAGGGKGAAIGAIIGGGAGAGSVYAQGRDDLELKAGSSVTVQASSPIR